MALQWGIASAGKIANDFVNALQALPREEHQVVTVAARSLQSAETFAKAHAIPKSYEGYINLARDKDVQVVYIAVLNPQHHEVAKLMLEHGKHVLCEKPFTTSEKHTREIIELARSKNLFIMEAVWSRFFPVYQEIRELLNSGAIGEIKYASIPFGAIINQYDRITRRDHGGSITLNFGVYALQFLQLVFKGLKPLKIVSAGHLNEDGVDITASTIFTYPGKKIAVISCNGTADLSNEALIVGTKGTIKIPTFWAPVSYILNGNLKEIPLIKNDGKFNYENSAGLAYEAVEVRKRILQGDIESQTMPHDETIQLAIWMDMIRRDIGVLVPTE